MWLSPIFKLWLLKEFQKLKKLETNRYLLEWDINRIISKKNYRIQTDAIKEKCMILSVSSKSTNKFEYIIEADILNKIVFNMTAKTWKKENPKLVLENKNIRYIASINDLIILSNLESINAEIIRNNISQQECIKTNIYIF